MAMSFTLVASCREALSGVVSTRLIREQEAEDAKAKAYEEVSTGLLREESVDVLCYWRGAGVERVMGGGAGLYGSSD